MNTQTDQRDQTFNYHEMKQKDIRVLKEKLWLQNGKKCPVLDLEIPLEKMTLDHAHKRKDEEYGPKKGVIREALDWRVNAILGKMENALKRTGLEFQEGFDLPTMLRNAADYFEKGAYVDADGFYYVHPKEVKKQPLVSKKHYNELKKAYERSHKRAKFPEYPKSKKLTKRLNELFDEFDITWHN